MRRAVGWLLLFGTMWYLIGLLSGQAGDLDLLRLISIALLFAGSIALLRPKVRPPQ